MCAAAKENFRNVAKVFCVSLSLQEVGSIIGKKGEIVKRFRDEVSIQKSLGFFLSQIGMLPL